MKPATFFQIFICLAFTPVFSRVSAQDYIPDTSYWETRASMNQARSYFPAVVSGGKIYAIGGGTSQTSYTDKIEAYDPAGTDVWTVIASLPQPMNGMAAVELSGAIYIIGGATDPSTPSAIDKVYRYFPATGTFDADTIASLPAARYYPAACAAGGKIYVFGGATAFYGPVKNDVYVYDPALNQWTSLADGLSIARAGHTAVAVGNNIYVIGGTTSWTGGGINSVEVYDFVNAAWVISTKNLSQARAGHGSAVLSDIIYALGGIETLSLNAMTVEGFRPEIAGDSWEAFENLNYDRRAFGCVAWPVNDNYGYIYIMGGNSGASVISSTQRLFIRITGAEEVSPIDPENALIQISNFPNPFDQNTTISYVLNNATDVLIAVYDGRGQLIATPVNTFQTVGKYHIPFDASRLEPGVYWCKLNTRNGHSGSVKIAVMR